MITSHGKNSPPPAAQRDEMRRPFLALKEAQNRAFSSASDPATPEEGIDRAIQAGHVLMAQYLRLGQYNPALEQDVQALSRDFEKWVVVVSELGRHWAEVQGTVREAASSTKNGPHNPDGEAINLSSLFTQAFDRLVSLPVAGYKLQQRLDAVGGTLTH